MPALILSVLALLLLGWFLGRPWLVEYRRKKIRQQPFPAQWRAILQQRMPYFRRLPADLQLQLKKHIQVFIAEKPFIGCAGLTVSDEMRVTIAAQACLLILNRQSDYYPRLRQILVYPGAFVVNKVHTDGIGVLQEQRQVLSGESWSQGQVILSWEDTLEGAGIADDGQNVVIHEFAHQLDQENGQANGAPILAPGQSYREWARTLATEFETLQAQANQLHPSLLNHYGATNAAEFFAVASEVFFERPGHMAEEHPDLYRQLSQFYRLNPLSW
ncbi:MAG TPA: M90 family metallopeptidase [Burkholderiaceae bacterium]|nr:M90 family metallopeptidase [Burkholderiaceae bacterium]